MRRSRFRQADQDGMIPRRKRQGARTSPFKVFDAPFSRCFGLFMNAIAVLQQNIKHFQRL
jgi:hypothetical protein